MTLDDLVELNTYEPSNDARGRSNGWDNLAGNKFRLETIRMFNAVVGCSGVGACHDEINMKILIVVLLEFQRSYFESLDPEKLLFHICLRDSFM